MKKSNRFSPEVRERAVRMVLGQALGDQYRIEPVCLATLASSSWQRPVDSMAMAQGHRQRLKP